MVLKYDTKELRVDFVRDTTAYSHLWPSLHFENLVRNVFRSHEQD